MYKFQTMVANADTIGGSSTADNDPRITKVGYWLRKTKLDELPQLFNILKGDMTFIGWRPESPEYLSTIPPEVLATKPAILGISTLWDSDEGALLSKAEDPDKMYLEEILPIKRKLELYYVQNQTTWLKTWIILETTRKMLRLPGVRVWRWYLRKWHPQIAPIFQ